MTKTTETKLSQSKGENMTKSHAFRCTDEVWQIINEKAQECGLCPSEYIRMVATGHKPKRRLTDEELSAIDTLEGCRKQVQQFLNRTKGMTESQRTELFRTPGYYKQWKAFCDDVCAQWVQIRKRLLSKNG